MKQKLTAGILAAVLGCSSVLAFSGCGSKEYPVTVANLKIEEEPKNIVILDPSAADIISYIGYDVKMVGRSDEVNQEFLSVVPSFGTAQSPDFTQIVESKADVVFADSRLSDDVRQKLEDEGISVIKLAVADSPKQLETAYITAGKILGGKTEGAKKGEDAHKSLIGDMEKLKEEADTSSIPATACYIYGEGNNLKIMSSGSYGDMLLSYTGAVNVAGNAMEDELDSETLKVANPNYIFYDNSDTLKKIKAPESGISELKAVKSGKMLEITSDEMTRQGFTALETLEKMIDFINGNIRSDVESETTQPVTTVADKYKIKLTDTLALKPEDENGNVKIMQQRLFDLGYVTDKDNITGYYGGISEQAVKNFQKKNGLVETGEADNATLQLMFSESALGAKDNAADIAEGTTVEQTEPSTVGQTEPTTVAQTEPSTAAE